MTNLLSSMPHLAITRRRARIGGLFAGAIFGLSTLDSRAQDAALPVPADSIMHEVSPGIYEVGKLRLNQATHTVTFPGAVNLDKGPLEYLLVTPSGNAHESLLVTSEVEPRDLHLAMLLLGAKGSGIHAPAPDDAPPTQLSKDYLEHAPKLTGDPLSITVKWKSKEGIEKKTPVEDWILKTDVHKPAERGPWIYNGSMFGTGGRFLAQVEGNFVALVTNPAALINNPRKGSDNDQVWDVNEKVVPPAKTPVEITLQLEEVKAETSGK